MEKKQKNTTMLRYVLLRVLPVVVPILLTVFILTYKFTHHTIEAQQKKNIENELSFVHQTLDDRFSVTKDWLKNLVQNGMIINSLVDPKGAGEYIPQLFKTLRVPGPQSTGHITLLDFQGNVLATNNIPTSLKIDAKNLKNVLNGDRYETIDHRGLIMAEPIVINGLPEGALVLIFDSSTLSDFLNVSVASTYINIIDEHSHFMFTIPGQDHFKIGDYYKEENLKDWVVSKKTIEKYPNLTLISLQKNSIAFQTVTKVQNALIAFVMINLMGIMLAISLAGRSVTEALAKMAEQFQILRTEKDLSKRIKISAIEELATLENAYNDMTAELQNTTVSKEYIDTLFEGMPIPVFVTDADGLIVRTNGPVLALFENTDHEMPAYFQDLILKKDLEKQKEELRHRFSHISQEEDNSFFYLAKKNGNHEIEMRFRNTGVEEKPYILSITSRKDSMGEVASYIITATDIYDRKKKEREIIELAEQNTLMARAIEEIHLGLTISDGQQRHQPLIFCNQAFIELSGRSMEEILGFSCNFMQGPETDMNTVKELSEAIRDQKSITVEILNYKKNGEKFWNELSLNPIFANDGTLKYYVGIQSDITDRKKIESMKKEFVSTVSHELRTPITSIHGSLGLMSELYEEKEGMQDAEEQELLSVAYRNSERLKFLIDDILDTEKLESGDMRFYLEQHLLSDVIKQGTELNALYGEKYGVQFVISEDIPDVYIDVDKNRMIQVFANLLSNAAKFSKDSNKVDIYSTLIDQKNMVRISVQDYGDGISQVFQDRLFTKFAQQDSSDARNLPGTGLGLYISRKIITAHSGTIDFETEPGQGTTFYIDLPCHTYDQKKDLKDETA